MADPRRGPSQQGRRRGRLPRGAGARRRALPRRDAPARASTRASAPGTSSPRGERAGHCDRQSAARPGADAATAVRRRREPCPTRRCRRPARYSGDPDGPTRPRPSRRPRRRGSRPTSRACTRRSSRSSTSPRRSRGRCSRATRATRGRCAGSSWTSSRTRCRRCRRSRATRASARPKLYETIFLGYGDDSVAQLGARARRLRVGLQRPDEDPPAPAASASPTSSSPRATSPTTLRWTADGRYRYYRDPELGPRLPAGDGLAVRRRTPTPCPGWRRGRPRQWPGGPPASRPAAHARAVCAKALDLLRGLLPRVLALAHGDATRRGRPTSR